MIHDGIQLWNRVAEHWTLWLGASILDATVVLVVVSLLWLAFRRSASPQLGYLLFLLVPLKLFVPLEISLPERLVAAIPFSVSSLTMGTPYAEPVEPASIAPSTANFGPETVQPIVQPENAGSGASATAHRSAATTNPPAAGPDAVASAVEQPLPLAVEQRINVSLRGWMMGVWILGVLALLCRLIRAQIRFHRVIRGVKPVDPAQLAVDFAGLLERVGVRRPVRIVECDAISTPAVWGLLRPTLILPVGIVATLSNRQLEWVLLHELAHIRRRDLLANCFQRLAAILHFLNPAIWLANRMIDRLREYACDDLALALGRGSQLESGEAFMGVIRYAATIRRRPQRCDGAIGVFDAKAGASCFQRMKRLLDTDRRVRVKLGLGSLCLLVLTAALALPQMRAADPSADIDKADATPSVVPRFELLVQGPDGKPVPDAAVEVRLRPGIDDWTVHAGSFVNHAKYGPHMRTGKDGRLVFDLPNSGPQDLELYITNDGYAPFSAQWNTEDQSTSIPPQYTAKLDAGMSVGGIVVDESGRPVEGVKIHPTIKFKKREGDLEALHVGGSVPTNADGSWSYDSVPAAMDKVTISLSHPEYMPLSTSIATAQFAVKPGVAPTAKIVIKRGLTVIGKVSDESGRPIQGADVRTKFLNDEREATTNAEGVYQLVGCKPVRTSLVVTAAGRAPDLKSVQIEERMSPVDFTLGPGRTIRVRVLDSAGKPIPKSRILFRSWRGDPHDYELGTIHEYTNDDGIWEWQDAPTDAVVCSIYPPEHMEIENQSLIAREEEYVYKPSPALIISGTVIDAETKAPIEKFRVVPGVRFDKDSMGWTRRDSFDSTAGTYRIKHIGFRFAHLVRIEAAGYQPANSRDIKSDEGSVTVDFELKKGKNVAAKVVSPDGQVAVGADVALGFADSQIFIKNGEFTDSTYCARARTDGEGRFDFPPQEAPCQLIVTHQSGFASVNLDPADPPATIQLRPWARIEGIQKVGSAGAADIPTGLAWVSDDPNAIARNVSISNEGTSDKQGRFVFARVFPGKARISRTVIFNRSQRGYTQTSSHAQSIELKAGETAQVTLGGTGRPVIAQLEVPAGTARDVDWNFSHVTIQPKLPDVPPAPIPDDIKDDPKQVATWWKEWSKSDAGQAWSRLQGEYNERRAASSNYVTTVASNGRFRMDDVPAGEYELSIRLESVPDDGIASPSHTIGTFELTLAVPAMDGGRSDEPLDLGTLTLEGVPQR